VRHCRSCAIRWPQFNGLCRSCARDSGFLQASAARLYEPGDISTAEIERRYHAHLQHLKATRSQDALELTRGGSSLTTGAPWPTWLRPQ
jgi:hypothetical protein